MLIPPFKPKLPEIAESGPTPVVRSLWQVIADWQAQVQRLEDEIRRLQGGPPRPPLKPNPLEPAGTAAADGALPRRRGPQRAKTAEWTMHATERVPLADVPEGSEFKGYRPFVVQEWEIRPHHTRHLLEHWRLPAGDYVTAPVPVPAVGGGHYGPRLIGDLRHPYYRAPATRPPLLAQLHDWGIERSAGPLNHRPTEGHDAFHQEKAELKAAGLATSGYVQADDTGARHQGRHGYCTDIGNERFAWFASTESKSRANCLELLQAERRHEVNAAALAYMAQRGLAAGHRNRPATRPVVLTDPKDWAAHRRQNLADRPRAVALATEGALIGGLAAPGFALDIGLVSDAAGPFDRFGQGRCWVHAARPLSHLVPLNESDRRAIAWVRQPLWFLYRDLKAYRPPPDPAANDRITAGFEALCATATTGEPLNQVLHGLQRDRAARLRVLDRPDLPIHNNRGETDRRDMVKKRKIGAGTRSAVGRPCRDPFASLKKTCRKQAISFGEYLNDRVAGLNVIPSLAELIRRPATA